MTWTYFIQAGNHGLIKIGRASNPTRRLTELQTGSADELRLIGVVEGDYENRLHLAFDHLRVRGEWFESTVELRSFIDTYAMPIDRQQGIERAARVVVDAHGRMSQEIMDMWCVIAAKLNSDGECKWPHLTAFDDAVAMLRRRLRQGGGTHLKIDDSPQIRQLDLLGL